MSFSKLEEDKMSKAKEFLEILTPQNEKAHQYTPHLEAMKKHLMAAETELHAMLDMEHDGIVAPSEIHDMNAMENMLKGMLKKMKEGYK